MSTLQRRNNIHGTKSPSKATLVRSKSTDHLVSTAAFNQSYTKTSNKFSSNNIGSSNNVNIQEKENSSTGKIAHLSKPKSTKSLKAKHKSAVPNKQISSGAIEHNHYFHHNPKSTTSTAKKTKKAKKHNKTILSQTSKTFTKKKKKNIVLINLSDESFNSTETASKPPSSINEYFLYHNIYVPIQNSAQRRFVIKIKQIDEQREHNNLVARTLKETDENVLSNTVTAATADGFYPKSENDELAKTTPLVYPLPSKTTFIDHAAQTEKVQIVETGTQMTPRNSTQFLVQTDKQPQLSLSEPPTLVRSGGMAMMEDSKKCFGQTLDDLQFLYLPDQKNFQGFSKQEKLHYKQLFEAISKKIWTNGTGQLETLTDQKIQVMLCERQCEQMGMIPARVSEEGFPTHAFAVMSYLTNLFCFVQMHETEAILERLHYIYGFTHDERIKRVLQGRITKRQSPPIISEQLFLNLEAELVFFTLPYPQFSQHDFEGSQVVQKAVHIHNKAIFDAVNEQLEKFKPFYGSKGEPFPWSISLGMTFFNIDESCLPYLFKQTKQKILVKMGNLCGLHLDYDQFSTASSKQEHQEKHPHHVANLKTRQTKIVQQQICQMIFQPEFQESELKVRIDLQTLIFSDLLKEVCDQLQLQKVESKVCKIPDSLKSYFSSEESIQWVN